MRGTGYRVCIWMLVLLTGGLMFQAGNCFSFGTENTLAATNWCGIINCQSGLLGGLISPCGSPLTSADDLFQDCPAPITIDTTTGTTTDTTTDTTTTQ